MEANHKRRISERKARGVKKELARKPSLGTVSLSFWKVKRKAWMSVLPTFQKFRDSTKNTTTSFMFMKKSTSQTDFGMI